LTALGLFAFRAWRTRTYLACLGIALLAALPWVGIWPTALYLRNPELFREWFWVNNIGLFTGGIELASANRPFFYFGILPFYALLFALRRERARPLLPWALAHTLTLGLVAALFLPTLDYGKSYRGPAFSLAQNLPLLRPCVASIGLGEPQRAMLDYYTGIITT